MKKIILGAMLALAALPAMAQQQMYLIKGQQVVAKYDVDDVDYVSFTLPDDVIDEPLAVKVDRTAKNSLTYSVTTTNPMTAYAHGIVSWNTLNNYALSFYDDEFDNLPEGTRQVLLKALLEDVGYLAMGNGTFEMVDWADDGSGYKLSVRGGIKYYVMAWEVDLETREGKDCFVYTSVTTPEPDTSPYTLDVKVASFGDESVIFDFSGTDSRLQYVLVALLEKSTADLYRALVGLDYIINTWAYPWDTEGLYDDAEWAIYEPGEYTLLARGVDANGDIADLRLDFTYEGKADDDMPKIIFNTHSINGNIFSANIEVQPGNIDEAYVYIDTENNIDDKKNAGYELWEIASSSKATDISLAINNAGEYNYSVTLDDDAWYNILVYVKDLDGNKTVARAYFDFFDGESNYWQLTCPAKAPRAKAPKFRNSQPSSLKKIQK